MGKIAYMSDEDKIRSVLDAADKVLTADDIYARAVFETKLQLVQALQRMSSAETITRTADKPFRYCLPERVGEFQTTGKVTAAHRPPPAAKPVSPLAPARREPATIPARAETKPPAAETKAPICETPAPKAETARDPYLDVIVDLEQQIAMLNAQKARIDAETARLAQEEESLLGRRALLTKALETMREVSTA